MKKLDKPIAQLESELGLQNGFFEALNNEDDWSFILKCHALMESACSYLLTSYFGNEHYEDIFSRLEMSDTKKGKVAFLRAAELVKPEEASFITGLSELRNNLIHNIRGVTFSFSEHISSLDKNQKQKFVKSFGYAYLEYDENNKPIVKKSNIVLNDPKSAVYNGVRIILGVIMIEVETKGLQREQDELLRTPKEELQKKIYELTNSLKKRYN